ncbi:hypothetical protein Poli38472_002625 [Pythium oligandrum]|uniref:Uncharacterized protein n=1 Tax=Pythium oligandrum TaxID=41045 RepID=A0A8K1CHJ0_PYTOL|nr:hypothetical protein Poli38472_002625 [Pythium oligandrum]|eukprot:TMW63684.1 hypothetical protein Poli38472_002625 [Pythium oligandrum]
MAFPSRWRRLLRSKMKVLLERRTVRQARATSQTEEATARDELTMRAPAPSVIYVGDTDDDVRKTWGLCSSGVSVVAAPVLTESDADRAFIEDFHRQHGLETTAEPPRMQRMSALFQRAKRSRLSRALSLDMRKRRTSRMSTRLSQESAGTKCPRCCGEWQPIKLLGKKKTKRSVSIEVNIRRGRSSSRTDSTGRSSWESNSTDVCEDCRRRSTCTLEIDEDLSEEEQKPVEFLFFAGCPDDFTSVDHLVVRKEIRPRAKSTQRKRTPRHSHSSFVRANRI